MHRSLSETGECQAPPPTPFRRLSSEVGGAVGADAQLPQLESELVMVQAMHQTAIPAKPEKEIRWP